MTRTGLNGGVTTTTISNDNVIIGQQGTRDGAGIVADWALARAIEGKVFTAQLGTAGTPIAGDVYDADQPWMALDVSTGFAAILLSIQVVVEDAAAAINEMIAETSATKTGAGSSTAITPVNHKTGGGAPQGTTAFGAYTGNGTAATGGVEFWRDGEPDIQAAGSNVKFEWFAKDYGPVILVDESSLLLHFGSGGTDPTGFGRITYVEVPASRVS